MPNPRGSTGYGQKFSEDIKDDWGGKPFDDIMAVVDHVATLSYADADRMVAAGGSYGGYMVDWMLGHTQRFKALVSHAGVYDLRSEFGATEELSGSPSGNLTARLGTIRIRTRNGRPVISPRISTRRRW